MITLFIGVLVIVSLFTWLAPQNLLFGKEEHSNPQLDPSALKDQIEDLIHLNVKAESLKSPEEKAG